MGDDSQCLTIVLRSNASEIPNTFTERYFDILVCANKRRRRFPPAYCRNSWASFFTTLEGILGGDLSDIVLVNRLTRQSNLYCYIVFLGNSSSSDSDQSFSWLNLDKCSTGVKAKKDSYLELKESSDISKYWLRSLVYKNSVKLTALKSESACAKLLCAGSRPNLDVIGGQDGTVATMSRIAEIKNRNNLNMRMTSLEHANVVHINSSFPYKGEVVRVNTQNYESFMNFMKPREHPTSNNFIHVGNAELPNPERYPAHRAAAVSDIEYFRTLFDSDGSKDLMSTYDNSGWTVFHWAVWHCCNNDRLELLDLVTSFGEVDVNAVSKCRFGLTPLAIAAMNSSLSVIERLLELIGDHLDFTICDRKHSSVLKLLREQIEASSVAGECLVLIERFDQQPFELYCVATTSDDDEPMLHCVTNKGANTVIEDLLLVACDMLDVAATGSCKCFSIWTKHGDVLLQLKSNHKLVETKRMLRVDRSNRLFLMRDFLLSLEMERQLCYQNVNVLRLMFNEAKMNYVDGLYPVSSAETFSMSRQLLLLLFLTNKTTHPNSVTRRDIDAIVPITKNSEHLHRRLLTLVQPENTLPDDVMLKFMEKCWALREYGATHFPVEIVVESDDSRGGRSSITATLCFNYNGVFIFDDRKEVCCIKPMHAILSFVPSFKIYLRLTSYASIIISVNRRPMFRGGGAGNSTSSGVTTSIPQLHYLTLSLSPKHTKSIIILSSKAEIIKMVADTFCNLSRPNEVMLW